MHGSDNPRTDCSDVPFYVCSSISNGIYKGIPIGNTSVEIQWNQVINFTPVTRVGNVTREDGDN